MTNNQIFLLFFSALFLWMAYEIYNAPLVDENEREIKK